MPTFSPILPLMPLPKRSFFSPLLLLHNFDAIPISSSVSPRKASSLAPVQTMKSAADLANYWTSIMRAEEDAMQGTRPWQRLEFVPIYDEDRVISSVKGVCLHWDYAFGKSTDLAALQQLKLNELDVNSSLITLRYPFGPSTLPEGIEPRKWREAFEQANVHLLAVNNEPESKLNVQKLIAAAQPDVVMVELVQRPFSEYVEEEAGEYNNLPGENFAELGWIEQRSLIKAFRRDFDALPKDHRKRRSNQCRAAFAAGQKVKGCAGLILGDSGDEQFRHATEEMGLAQWPVLAGTIFKRRDQREKEIEAERDRHRHMIKVLHTLLHRLTIEKLWASQRMGVDFDPVSAVAVVEGTQVKGIEEKWARTGEVYGEQKMEGQ